MNNETSELKKIYSPLFESALLKEIEEKSMLFTTADGQGLIKMGQPINVVPMMLSGTMKVSRENEDGQELVLYYARAGQGYAMTLSCGMRGSIGGACNTE